MTESSSAALPLAGYRVVDLTANISGPFCTAVLAEQGADVVKVEPPGGEILRGVGTLRAGTSALFANLNAGKRSVVLDFAAEEGGADLRRLFATADVVVENFRPGVADRVGAGYDAARAVQPRVVYCSIDGWGSTGPWADRPAYDHIVQAASGFAAAQAGKSGPPNLVRNSIVDKTTALTAAQAITAALLHRERTGAGTRLEVPMIDAAVWFFWSDGMMDHTFVGDAERYPAVSRSFRLTATADGWLAMVTLAPSQWAGLLRAAGLAELADDPRFTTTSGRMRHGGAVMRRIADGLAQIDTASAVQRLTAEGVPCSAVVGLDDLVESEPVAASGIVEEHDHPTLGRLRRVHPPVLRDGALAPLGRRSPTLGEHTDEVLGPLRDNG